MSKDIFLREFYNWFHPWGMDKVVEAVRSQRYRALHADAMNARVTDLYHATFDEPGVLLDQNDPQREIYAVQMRHGLHRFVAQLPARSRTADIFYQFVRYDFQDQPRIANLPFHADGPQGCYTYQAIVEIDNSEGSWQGAQLELAQAREFGKRDPRAPIHCFARRQNQAVLFDNQSLVHAVCELRREEEYLVGFRHALVLLYKNPNYREPNAREMISNF